MSWQFLSRLLGFLQITAYLPKLQGLPFQGLAAPLNAVIYGLSLFKNLLGALSRFQLIGLSVGYGIWFLVKNWEHISQRLPLLEKAREAICNGFAHLFSRVFSWLESLIKKLQGFGQKVLGEWKLNPFAADSLPQPQPIPLPPLAPVKPSEKTVKVIVSGENLPAGVRIKAEEQGRRSFDLPRGMSLQFSG